MQIFMKPMGAAEAECDKCKTSRMVKDAGLVVGNTYDATCANAECDNTQHVVKRVRMDEHAWKYELSWERYF